MRSEDAAPRRERPQPKAPKKEKQHASFHFGREFELPDTDLLTTPKQRINRERFVWFGNFAKARRKPHSLTYFIADDSMFKSSALDAYSQAWALSFFLIETRSAEYSKYLKLMRSREATSDYSAEERLEDFKKAFGSNLDALDAHFLRFIEQLN